VTKGFKQAPKASLPPICSQGYTCSTGTSELPCTVANTLYQWTTGGGISNYIERPYWQNATVSKYLAQKIPFPPSGSYIPGNRLYPDVAAFGSRILVVSGGAISVSAGTSASTPIVAGIMTLINEARFNAGKPSIGFWNPALYAMHAECPQCFNTIASGNNRKF
jgi:tripeptidyl-peptidase-1